MPYNYHLTVRACPPGMFPTYHGVNVVDLPEPLSTFNGVALALGRVSQILRVEHVEVDQIVIMYAIEIRPGRGLPRSADASAGPG